METTSYVQSAASFRTLATIRLGVSFGPERNDRLSDCPVARIFTEVPPTSTTKTLCARFRPPAAALRDLNVSVCRVAARLRLPTDGDLTLTRIPPTAPLRI